MCPNQQIQDLPNGTLVNTITRSQFSLANAAVGIFIANFNNLRFGQFCTVMFTTCRITAICSSMLAIFLWGNPFKVIAVVIERIAIFVINKQARLKSWNKRFCDFAMRLKSEPFPIERCRISYVAKLCCLTLENAERFLSKTKSHAAHSAKIADLKKSVRIQDRKPFFHNTQHYVVNRHCAMVAA